MERNVAFFCVCNAKHFVALAAMLNSLRTVGHRETVYITDCGLTETQRNLVGSLDGVELLDPPHVETRVAPHVAHRLYGPSVVDVDVAVVTDVDIIFRYAVMSHFGDKSVFFLNDQDRFDARWSMLGYPTLERRRYLNAGLMFLTRDHIAPIQEAIAKMNQLTSSNPDLYRSPADPFYWAEQDAMNAYLASVPADTFAVSAEMAFWPFKNFDDEAVLHHIQPKPWLVPRAQNIYTREMTRLLYTGPLRLPDSEIPHRFRRNPTGVMLRRWYTGRYYARRYTRGKIGLRKKRGSRHFATA